MTTELEDDTDATDQLEAPRRPVHSTVGVVDPVEILVQLVKNGQKDPWEIDIVEVTDGFLKELERIGHEDPLLLARSARCLFYAAALVHLKAEALNDPSLLFDDAPNFDDYDDADWDRPERLDCPLFYPRADARLVPRERQPRGRSITLVDLLDALRRLDVQALIAPASEQPAYEFDPWDDGIEADILDIPTAHEDDLEGDILRVREDLRVRFEAEELEISIDEMRGTLTRGEAFRALLFLANDGEVDFVQDGAYGELHITPGPEPLKEISEDEKARRQANDDRRTQAREKREERREIPNPKAGPRRGRNFTRRPGLAPNAASRRPRGRSRGPRAALRGVRGTVEDVDSERN